MTNQHLFIHGSIHQVFIEQLLYARYVRDWYNFALPRIQSPAEDKSLMVEKHKWPS